VSRVAFALLYPVLVIALGGLIFADAIAAGFHGEGCRSAGDVTARWAGAREWLLVQGVFLLLLGLLLWTGKAMIASQLGASGPATWIGRAILLFGLTMFAAFLIGTLHFTLNCGGATGPSPLSKGLADLMRPVSFGAAGLLAVSLITGYVLGLVSNRPGLEQ
jgi:hypothetical protein